jgi:hypothetical protein
MDYFDKILHGGLMDIKNAKDHELFNAVFQSNLSRRLRVKELTLSDNMAASEIKTIDAMQVAFLQNKGGSFKSGQLGYMVELTRFLDGSSNYIDYLINSKSLPTTERFKAIKSVAGLVRYCFIAVGYNFRNDPNEVEQQKAEAKAHFDNLEKILNKENERIQKFNTEVLIKFISEKVALEKELRKKDNDVLKAFTT